MKWHRQTLLVLLVAATCGAMAAENETPPFFDALKEEGAWFKLCGTAWAWQPAVMQQDPGWRPYLHGGSWTRLDEANWFWVSEYAWGAIAFHYGRWFATEAYGWLWVPGTQWCPAWVDWRLTPTYSGWTPLPPDDAFFTSIGVTNFAVGWQQYAFVPNSGFLARDLRPLVVDGTDFAQEAVTSFTGPEPNQVGYVAPEDLVLPATMIVEEQEVFPVYTETRSTVYLREPVLTYSPCRVYVEHGTDFYARHPPACRRPVQVRRPSHSRSPGPPPPVRPVVQAPPPRPVVPPRANVPAPRPPPPRPPTAVKPPPPRPPTAVKPPPPRPPTAVTPPPPRPPTAVKPQPPRPPTAVKPPTPRPPTSMKPPTPRPPTAVKPPTPRPPTVVNPSTPRPPSAVKPPTPRPPAAVNPPTPRPPATVNRPSRPTTAVQPPPSRPPAAVKPQPPRQSAAVSQSSRPTAAGIQPPAPARSSHRSPAPSRESVAAPARQNRAERRR